MKLLNDINYFEVYFMNEFAIIYTLYNRTTLLTTTAICLLYKVWKNCCVMEGKRECGKNHL